MSVEWNPECEVVEIVNVKGEPVWINKEDYDAKTMKLWEGSEEQKAANKAKK